MTRPWERRDVGGVEVDFATADHAVDALLQLAADLPDANNVHAPAVSAPGVAVHFANAYTISLAAHDAVFSELLNRPGSLVMADGRPVVWAAARIYGASDASAGSWEQVCGPETMPAILQRSEHTSVSHYFLGGSEATLAALVAEVRRRYPDTRIAGWASPPFRALTEAEREAQAARIEESGATIVWDSEGGLGSVGPSRASTSSGSRGGCCI